MARLATSNCRIVSPHISVLQPAGWSRLTSTVEVPPPHTCRHGGAILSGPIAENNRAIFQSWPHGTGLDWHQGSGPDTAQALRLKYQRSLCTTDGAFGLIVQARLHLVPMVTILCTAFLISQFYRASVGVLGPIFMAEMGLSANMLHLDSSPSSVHRQNMPGNHTRS